MSTDPGAASRRFCEQGTTARRLDTCEPAPSCGSVAPSAGTLSTHSAGQGSYSPMKQVSVVSSPMQRNLSPSLKPEPCSPAAAYAELSPVLSSVKVAWPDNSLPPKGAPEASTWTHSSSPRNSAGAAGTSTDSSPRVSDRPRATVQYNGRCG